MKAQKSKSTKSSEARKKAEAQKAKKKALRDTKAKGAMGNAKPGKGKSAIPQSKKK